MLESTVIQNRTEYHVYVKTEFHDEWELWLITHGKRELSEHLPELAKKQCEHRIYKKVVRVTDETETIKLPKVPITRPKRSGAGDPIKEDLKYTI